MIGDYLKAGYPMLCVLTQEPHRAETVLRCGGWKYYLWDCIRGIADMSTTKIIDEIHDPVEAVKWISCMKDSVLMAHNLHLFMDVPELLQVMQNSVEPLKRTGSALLIISPSVIVKPEIEKFIHVLELPLPGEDELFDMQNTLGSSYNIKPNRKAARCARGLTLFETETAYSFSLIKKKYFSSKVITEAKSQMIKKSGLMEFREPADIKDVGGLGLLKSYIANRSKAFSADNDNLPRLKAILLAGIPGTGKSLTSKAAASLLGWPLISLDIGALKHSHVGESERRIRLATKVIDAFGHAVIWLDEVEKAFAGAKGSGETDGGTTASMFGHFLTWMSETVTPILVMATANNISQLPPEFLRAGRFDATFFVDQPTKCEREEIIRIMNRKWKSNIPIEFADKLAGYTGAEIEQLAKDSLFDGLEKAYDALIPLSRTMREEINSLREWAKTRARPANTPDEANEDTRKLRIN